MNAAAGGLGQCGALDVVYHEVRSGNRERQISDGFPLQPVVRSELRCLVHLLPRQR